MRVFRIVLRLAALLPLLAQPALAAKLPALGADPARVSVSGLSSGGYMALQYDVAFSASTMGVGVVAAGPYDCVSVTPGGLAGCTGGAPQGAASWGSAQGYAAAGAIDPTENLKRQRVYIYRGQKDPIVTPSVTDAVREFFAIAKTPAANVQYVNDLPAGHAFVSADGGDPCDRSAQPFVVRCERNGAPYDQPGEILGHIYGPLKPRAATLSAAPAAFDQGEFSKGLAGLAKTGWIYVPAACAGSSCAVHVVFHGCGQSAKFAKDAVYAHVGFNAWADANGIVVLYPQVDPTLIPLNPEGCWDWWGTTGFNFQTRSGAQLSAIHAMVQRLLAPRQ